MAQVPPFDKEDVKRRMKGAVATLKNEFAGLRTGEPIACSNTRRESPMSMPVSFFYDVGVLTLRSGQL